MKRIPFSTYALFLTLLTLLTACSNVKTLQGADLDAVLAYSEPKADLLFQGLNANDYATFSTDFNGEMKDAIDEQGLADIENMVVARVGKYLSRQVDTVQQSGDFMIVIYKANFEQEEGVRNNSMDKHDLTARPAGRSDRVYPWNWFTASPSAIPAPRLP
jgi:hypothetical protein